MSSAPPLPSASALQACETALEQVVATVAVARGLASAGRAVNLGGLEAAAGRVCAQILDLPPGDGAAFRPALEALDNKLGLLSDALKRSP